MFLFVNEKFTGHFHLIRHVRDFVCESADLRSTGSCTVAVSTFPH